MKIVIALIAVGLTGCITMELATVALVSDHQPVDYDVVAPRVKGQDCSHGFTPARFDNAMRDALYNAPGADALADVTLSIDRKCYRVEGKAVRISPE
ncbi:MAG: hypothetical protein GY937_02950 [bacterium]|nr:hypothetical protein [bacterium]